jgi:hypothetical protein
MTLESIEFDVDLVLMALYAMGYNNDTYFYEREKEILNAPIAELRR